MIVNLAFLWPLVALSLYAPPIWVVAGQRFLRKHPPPIRFLKDLTLIGLFLSSVGLATGFAFGQVMPMWSLSLIGIPFNYPYISILMYLAFGYIILRIGEAKGWNPALTFSLVVYGVFAIGELWEWPIHFVSAQTDLIRTLLFTAPKILALPLFFYALIKRMWLPNLKWIVAVTATTLLGFALIPLVPESINPGLHTNMMMLQMYRLPWIALFLVAVRSTP